MMFIMLKYTLQTIICYPHICMGCFDSGKVKVTLLGHKLHICSGFGSICQQTTQHADNGFLLTPTRLAHAKRQHTEQNKILHPLCFQSLPNDMT